MMGCFALRYSQRIEEALSEFPQIELQFLENECKAFCVLLVLSKHNQGVDLYRAAAGTYSVAKELGMRWWLTAMLQSQILYKLPGCI
jgi:hypothetical protein